MSRLMICRGLPSSGKTTFANKLVGLGWKKVERDEIRKELIVGKWTPRKERPVIARRNELIRQYLSEGFNVVCSDTNLSNRVVEGLKGIGKEMGATVAVNSSFLEVPVEECIRRDNARANGVGESVIWRMYWEAFPPIKYTTQEGLNDAVIFDLDGTLADISHRNPYDATDAENDPVREHVAQQFRYYRNNAKIFIFSGRKIEYQEATVKFLVKHGLWWYNVWGPEVTLVMRPENDNRKDSVLKQEFFDTYIKDKYNVQAVFDDRPQVCRLWRSLGLPLFDVGMGVEF